jgi:large subunit ribosomal protein L23
MKTPYDIIVKPLLSEKSNRLKEHQNQVTFEVADNANKIEIRTAIEKLFKVSVLSVHTLRVPSKTKRFGRRIGRRPGWKKAIVTLRQGDQIQLFEGV